MPGQRVLLAGAGPFLLPVAEQLARAARRWSVAEATRRRDWLRRRAADGRPPWPAGRLRALPHPGPRRSPGATCSSRAEGDDRVRAATIARAARDWSPLPGASAPSRSTRSAPPTASCLVDARPHARLRLDGDAVAHDEDMRTTVANVFVAGEATGIGGADLALVEGELAGWMAAAHAARSANGNDRTPLAPRPPPARRDAEARRLRRDPRRPVRSRARPGALATPDTVICRCEDVTAGAVDAAVAGGATTMAALKIVTRCGQGRAGPLRAARRRPGWRSPSASAPAPRCGRSRSES